jgi:hypothetical protein
MMPMQGKESMSTHDLQIAYVAALARVGDSPVPEKATRHLPIFRRGGTPTQTQAVKDAANALRALWQGSREKQAKS